MLLASLTAHSQAPAEPPAQGPGEVTQLRTVFDAVDRFDDIEVVWVDGVLRLQGTVPTVAARDEAERVASAVPSVLFVDNLLKIADAVVPDDARDRDDDAIAEQLRTVFAQVPDLAEVQVEVTSGVVRLSGTVLDSKARDQAVELASGMDAVVYVSDRLEETTDVGSRLEPAIEGAWDQAQSLLARGPLLVIAVLIVGAFYMLARALSRWNFLFRRIKDRPLLRATLAQFVFAAVWMVGFLIALEILDAIALVGALVGAAGVFGLAVGFAFQDIVENYLAGLLLSLQQPFSKDDLVDIDGTKGVVLRLTTRNTLLLSPDGNHVYLPNATVFKSPLTNFSRNPRRRFDFAVGVGVEEDLAEVIRVGVDTLVGLPGVAADPAPAVRIGELGDSSVVMEVFGWVDQLNFSFVAVRTEAIRRVKDAFDEAGFDMPEPIYRVSMTQVEPSPKKPRKPKVGNEPALDLSADRELIDQAREQRQRDDGEDLLQAS